MTGALTYFSAAQHQAELKAAAERDLKAPGKQAGERRLPTLPWRRRPRRAYA